MTAVVACDTLKHISLRQCCLPWCVFVSGTHRVPRWSPQRQNRFVCLWDAYSNPMQDSSFQVHGGLWFVAHVGSHRQDRYSVACNHIRDQWLMIQLWGFSASPTASVTLFTNTGVCFWFKIGVCNYRYWDYSVTMAMAKFCAATGKLLVRVHDVWSHDASADKTRAELLALSYPLFIGQFSIIRYRVVSLKEHPSSSVPVQVLYN